MNINPNEILKHYNISVQHNNATMIYTFTFKPQHEQMKFAGAPMLNGYMPSTVLLPSTETEVITLPPMKFSVTAESIFSGSKPVVDQILDTMILLINDDGWPDAVELLERVGVDAFRSHFRPRLVIVMSNEVQTFEPSVNSGEFSRLAKSLPGAETKVDYPCEHDCQQWGNRGKMVTVVIHLNDEHKWPRELIADWLDELHDAGLIDIAFHEPVDSTINSVKPDGTISELNGWHDAGYTTEEENPCADLAIQNYYGNQIKSPDEFTKLEGGVA